MSGDLLRCEVILAASLFINVVQAVFVRWLIRKPKPRGPIISLDSPCPACGNSGCELHYDAITHQVKRQCKHCSCVVQQPPVAPSLFAQANQGRN